VGSEGSEGRHVALLVEDEPEMAAELKELLGSLGYDCVHASTQEEGQRLAEAGQFCFVLLDLQIKVNADSIRARIEAGLTLLEQIRARYPRRNAEDHHHLQILVMSGHAKEHQYVVKAFQSRADDFITKPIGENQPPFGDKIRDALRKSQRERHGSCPMVMKNAALPAGVARHAPAARSRLSITATKVKERREVKIDGRVAQLTRGSFLLLLQLVAAHLREKDGWVHRSDLTGGRDPGWKGISRLKAELAPILPEGVAYYDNDEKGSYRLHPDLEMQAVDSVGLASDEDRKISKLATEIGTIFKKVE